MSFLIKFINIMHFRIHKEGKVYFIIFLIITFISTFISLFLALFFLIVSFYIFYFFRDPIRAIPLVDVIVSPADGIVTYIGTSEPPIILNSSQKFIKVSIEGFERGIYILHFLGGSMIKIAGDRAVAQTKMTISQRGDVHGVECDIVCTGRFYDLIERNDGKWGVALRQPIYERDRMTPLNFNQSITLDPTILSEYPIGYQNLAYFQQGLGYNVKRDMPGLTGPEVEALYKQGAAWLRGEPDNWNR